MGKLKWMLAVAAISFLVAGCTKANDENREIGAENPPAVTEDANDAGATDNESSGPDTSNSEGKTDSPSSETTVEDEQKQMALDMLNDMAERAKEGKVYRPDQGFVIGKTTRKGLYNTIGEPEEKDQGYEHYHGSMGNPSVAFKYNGNGVLEEARYFGTNVERQTNLGGITEKDLTEQLGKPDDARKIEATGETNVRYHMGDFELQFIIGKDGKPDHVNLKKWQG
ncbi:YjgB family protein [Sporosarcina sp. Te-1]|uniref:YjgB family protein n=1 Tax=Sporosarcina sp. Te-1 TaxID=2818390 RepID=UPI001A9F4922|nr:YjgB family protein [Sporosarcina sp. Te-1]QTD40090.1 YjgB family protein [Sporosarcina sp. Te-1]